MMISNYLLLVIPREMRFKNFFLSGWNFLDLSTGSIWKNKRIHVPTNNILASRGKRIYHMSICNLHEIFLIDIWTRCLLFEIYFFKKMIFSCAQKLSQLSRYIPFYNLINFHNFLSFFFSFSYYIFFLSFSYCIFIYFIHVKIYCILLFQFFFCLRSNKLIKII